MSLSAGGRSGRSTLDSISSRRHSCGARLNPIPRPRNDLREAFQGTDGTFLAPLSGNRNDLTIVPLGRVHRIVHKEFARHVSGTFTASGGSGTQERPVRLDNPYRSSLLPKSFDAICEPKKFSGGYFFEEGG